MPPEPPEFEDGGNLHDEIQSFLDDPDFIEVLNVVSHETVNNNPTSNQDIEKDDDTTTAAIAFSSDVNHVEPKAQIEPENATTSYTENELTINTENVTSESNLNNIHPTVEKLRIVFPSMSSPSSIHSSSSECSLPVRSKKHKKRFCIKCNLRFKHTIDWLKHLEKHVSLPSIKLTRLDTSNRYYKEYLERCNNISKRRLSNETESLKIRLKIPRMDTTSNHVSIVETSDEQHIMNKPLTPILTPEATPPPPPASNECRLRVLRAEEIKLSPPRSLPKQSFLPENAMVSVPLENQIHYSCPTLDGLSQFAEDAMNEESTANILKQLLETPNENPDSSDWDSTPNEFISIDRLAHTCKVCDEKYPDIHYLQEHQRLTGHGDTNISPSMLEPIQEMVVDPIQQYRPPQTSQLEHILTQKSNLPPPQMQMYGQPPVLPIHQMENQIRNFPPMNQMQNRQRFSMPSQMPNRSRYPLHMPSNYNPMQFPHQAQMVRPNQQTNQPINMTPFFEMSPEMYNPRQQSNNGLNVFSRTQIMNRYMQQQQLPPPPSQHSPHQQTSLKPPQHSNLQRLPTHQMSMQNEQNLMQRTMQQPLILNGPLRAPMNSGPPQRLPMNGGPPQRLPMNGGSSIQSMNAMQRHPSMNGPLINRPLRNLPPNAPCAPNMVRQPQMMPIQRQTPPLSPLEQQKKARFEQMMRAREIENRPIILNAPRTEGLPVIESVQSGVITLEPHKKSNETGTTIQINDQITLSVKNKDGTSVKLPEKRVTPPITDSNKVANILVNRGITIKPTKIVDRTKSVDDLNKTPYATAEAAVQKLQMNNSVSIVQKKKVAIPTASTKDDNTIDLSNDDDASEAPDTFKRPTKKELPQSKPSILKCPMKTTCNMRFTNVKALRDHLQKIHQIVRLNRFKCTICLARFASSEAVRTHIQKTHGHSKSKPEFGIPVVNFNDPSVRKKMLSLGFTNFLPITNTQEEKNELFGMPIININGPSISNIKNLFNNNSAKVMPISSMRTIPRPKMQSTPSTSTSSSTSTITSASQSPRTSNLKTPTNGANTTNNMSEA